MRKFVITAIIMTSAVCANAQTLNVNTGSVTDAYSAEATGDMTFSGGTSLTIGAKTYSISDIASINIDADGIATDNTVNIVYSGTTANITVAGNIATYLTTTVNGAHVSIVADPSLQQEVTYTLSGTATKGSFYMDGDYKSTVVLNSVSITNPDSAAICIDNGKRINVEVNGTNTLIDGNGANAQQKAAFFINGHAEFSGSGSLAITGNYKHGYRSDEYTIMKKSFTGTITVTGAASDAMHIGQYFDMRNGNLDLTATYGDGIDIEVTKTATDSLNGQAIISGGTIKMSISGAACKGLKTDSAITISGGTFDITTTGATSYDTTEADWKSAAGIKCGSQLTISGGTLTLSSTGEGGKCINSDGDIVFSGGSLTASTTGEKDNSAPKTVKSDTNIIISGGSLTATSANSHACCYGDSNTYPIPLGTPTTFTSTKKKYVVIY